jgi:alpha-beta hydrolase superfamily lysophospholipase
MPKRIEFITDDEVKIVGEWVTAPTTIGAVILLHMYPATKESWASFQPILAQRGIASLAIDLRGHGESTAMVGGAVLDYQKFNEEETKSSINDVRGAYDWIRGRGVEKDRITVAGASIGANFALKFLAEEPQIPAAILLSPGLNYHGINVMDFVDYVSPHQSVWIVASRGDDDQSINDSAEIMKELLTQKKEFTKLEGAGHGTKMLEADAELMGQMADWLRDRIQ